MCHVERRRQGGLTLVEMLVALMIMGLVMTLVSQAVYQVSQITRAATATTAELAARWGNGWAITPVMGNLVVPPEAPIGKSFDGTARRIDGYTTVAIDGTGSGVKRFRIELAPAVNGDNSTRMLAPRLDAAASARDDAPVIAEFAGAAEFAFVDSMGVVSNQWPPPDAAVGPQMEELPRGVMVRRPGSSPLVWYPFLGDLTRPSPPASPFGATALAP